MEHLVKKSSEDCFFFSLLRHRNWGTILWDQLKKCFPYCTWDFIQSSLSFHSSHWLSLWDTYNAAFMIRIDFLIPRRGSQYWNLRIYSRWRLNRWERIVTAGGCKTNVLYNWWTEWAAQGMDNLQCCTFLMFVLCTRDKRRWLSLCGFVCVQVCVREKLLNIAFWGICNIQREDECYLVQCLYCKD